MANGITELVGELSRERWRSREDGNDFVIAEILAKLTRDDGKETESSVIVKGDAPIGEFIPGLTYRFGGRWDDDRVDPRTKAVEKQFKFTHYTKAEPHSRYGLVSYLAKFAPGIGPMIAGRLFDAFGSDAVKVLREFPEKAVVAANAGGRSLLTSEKAEAASAVLKSMGKMEDTKIELVGIFHGRGFPHTLVNHCIRVWGVLAPRRVHRDPFSLLVRRFPGCGFARCDRLYSDLGLPPGRLKRQMICLWHSLRTSGEGHTWFPADHCKRALEQAVSGVKVNFVRTVKLGLRSRWLAKHIDASGQLWLAEYAKAESEIAVADKLASLLSGPVELKPFTSDVGDLAAMLDEAFQIETKEVSNGCGRDNHKVDRIEGVHDGRGSEGVDASGSELAEHAGVNGRGPRAIDGLECHQRRVENWQLSSRRMTVFVATENKVITDAAPVVRKFVGQPIDNLELWLSRQGGFERRQLNAGQSAETHLERLVRRGRESGVCQFCQRELTHPTSRRLGYGPECGPKHGLPWVDDSEPVFSDDEIDSLFEDQSQVESEACHA
jgi:hypothetical protein